MNFDPERALSEAVFVVEADEFSRNSLRRQWGSSQTWLKWESEVLGFSPQVTAVTAVTIDGEVMPVVISINYALIGGQLVLFWHPTSQVVDYRWIETYLTSYVPAYTSKDAHGRLTRCDALNFADLISFLGSQPRSLAYSL